MCQVDAHIRKDNGCGRLEFSTSGSLHDYHVCQRYYEHQIKKMMRQGNNYGNSITAMEIKPLWYIFNEWEICSFYQAIHIFSTKKNNHCWSQNINNIIAKRSHVFDVHAYQISAVILIREYTFKYKYWITYHTSSESQHIHVYI